VILAFVFFFVLYLVRGHLSASEHNNDAFNLLIARMVLTLLCALPGLYLLKRIVNYADKGRPEKDKFKCPKMGNSFLVVILRMFC
jgi:hypothetical protein